MGAAVDDGSPAATVAARATLRDLVRSGEFRSLWSAHILSSTGDELATFALALLVFQRSGSAFLVALTLTLSVVPYALVGTLLAGLADRLPRRGLMVACDLARAVLVLAMLLPGLPLPVLWLLLFAVVSCQSPFTSARAATLPDILPGERYYLGSAVMNVTAECARFAGAVAGGFLVAAFSPQTALAVDAATFLASALLLRVGLRDRVVSRGRQLRQTTWLGVKSAAALIMRHRYLRQLTLLGLLGAFYGVPRALAVPFVAEHDGPTTAVGWLMAADPAGTIIGALLLGRVTSSRRRVLLMGPLAVLSCAPLMLTPLPVAVWVVVLFWMLAGLGTAYNLPANAEFVATVPPDQRGQAFGLVIGGMAGAQAITLLIAGALTQVFSAGAVVALFGALGTVCALLLAQSLRRSEHPG